MKKMVNCIQDKNPNLFVTRALKKQLYYQQKSNSLTYEQLQIQQQQALLKHYNQFKKRKELEKNVENEAQKEEINLFQLQDFQNLEMLTQENFEIEKLMNQQQQEGN